MLHDLHILKCVTPLAPAWLTSKATSKAAARLLLVPFRGAIFAAFTSPIPILFLFHSSTYRHLCAPWPPPLYAFRHKSQFTRRLGGGGEKDKLAYTQSQVSHFGVVSCYRIFPDLSYVRIYSTLGIVPILPI